MKTCREMGIKTVAIYSDADAQAVSRFLLVDVCCFIQCEKLSTVCKDGRMFIIVVTYYQHADSNGRGAVVLVAYCKHCSFAPLI